MKKLSFCLFISLLIGTSINAQSLLQDTFPQGMKYQAVARDLTGEIMSNRQVTLLVKLQGNERSQLVYYAETHMVTTNQFGLFSLVIGEGKSNNGDFGKIPWSSEDIWMEIAIKEGKKSNFTTISNSKLLAVPYAFHANTASKIAGTDSKNNLGGLKIWKLDGNKNINPLTDNLGTKDEADLNIVTNDTTRLKIKKDGKSVFKGQVTVHADIPDGDQGTFNDYPLRVEGGRQGIAVSVVSQGDLKPDFTQNFITFFDDDNNALGRIEGNEVNLEVYGKILKNALIWYVGHCEESRCINVNGDELCFDNEADKNVMRSYFDDLQERHFNFQITVAPLLADGNNLLIEILHVLVKWAEIGFTAGIGSLISDPDDAIFDGVKFVNELLGWILNVEIALLDTLEEKGGVSFESGGADYAEWLLKADPNENMHIGDVVGIKGGKISKAFSDADQYMAITSNPIIVGAMPKKGDENNFAKVGLMGQVRILVRGQVNSGDYILPSGRSDGSGVAVHPKKMRASEYSKIIGVAWSNSDSNKTFNYINTAIGFNTNQMGMMLNKMQNVMNKMQTEMVKLNPDYKPIYFDTDESNNSNNSLAFGIDSDNFFGFVKDFINQNPTPGQNGSVIQINGIETGNIVNKIIKRYINKDMAIDDVEAGNIINKVIRKYLNEWGGEGSIIDDNLIRKVIERTKEIDGEEINLVVELMKKYLDERLKPLIKEQISDIFDPQNDGIIDLNELDCFPLIKEFLIKVRNNEILDSGLDIDEIKQHITQVKEGITFLRSLHPK